MNLSQIEWELNSILEDAAEAPAIADLQALWQHLEFALRTLSIQQQLRLGSQVIDRLVSIYQAKAEFLLADWEDSYNPQAPTLSDDWLKGLVRQSQHVDFSQLTAPVKGRPRGTTSRPKSSQETIVSEVSKANLLQMLDQVEVETQKAAALAVAHEERIQDWVAELNQWFDDNPEPLSLLQLRQQLNWPLVQLWLSLLLGGFCLETTTADFYSESIQVSRLGR